MVMYIDTYGLVDGDMDGLKDGDTDLIVDCYVDGLVDGDTDGLLDCAKSDHIKKMVNPQE